MESRKPAPVSRSTPIRPGGPLRPGIVAHITHVPQAPSPSIPQQQANDALKNTAADHELLVRVGHAISDHAGYFRVIYSFFTLTSLFTGPSRFMNGVRVVMWFQWLLVAICFSSGLAYFVFLLPDYEDTCCIKPHVKRRDIGSCADAASIIAREIVGISSIKQECGSSTIALVATYACFVGSLVLVIVIHAAQVEEAYRSYKHLINTLKDKVRPATWPLKVLDETAEAVLFAVDVVLLRHKTANKAKELYWWPESFLFGHPLIMFHGWWWVVLQTSLTLIASFSFAYYFEIVDKLWRAWGCYLPGTSIDDLDNGICTSGWYKKTVSSFISVFVGCGAVLVKLLIHYVGRTTAVSRISGYKTHIKSLKLVSDSDKNALIEFIEEHLAPSAAQKT